MQFKQWQGGYVWAHCELSANFFTEIYTYTHMHTQTSHLLMEMLFVPSKLESKFIGEKARDNFAT